MQYGTVLLHISTYNHNNNSKKIHSGDGLYTFFQLKKEIKSSNDEEDDWEEDEEEEVSGNQNW